MREERRRWVRVRARLLTFVKSLKTGQVQRTLTKDISGGGVCILSEESFQQGEELEVQIKLPDREQPLAFKAGVSWVRLLKAASKSYKDSTFEIGMQFTAIDPKVHALMMQYAMMNALPPGAEG